MSDHHPDIVQRIAENRGRELDRAVEQIAGLEAERDGWRSENDRHRALYIDAVKERDALRAALRGMEAERDRLRAENAELRETLSVDDLDVFIREQGPDFAALVRIRGVEAERDRLANHAKVAEIEQNRLRMVIEARDDCATVVMKIMRTIDGGRRVWGDPLLDQVVAAVAELEAERDRLRTIVDGNNLYSMLDLLEDSQRVTAENARLRAVVEAVRRIRERSEDETFSLVDDEASELSDALDRALDTLDISGTIGGNAGRPAPEDGPTGRGPKVSRGEHITGEREAT